MCQKCNESAQKQRIQIKKELIIRNKCIKRKLVVWVTQIPDYVIA